MAELLLLFVEAAALRRLCLLPRVGRECMRTEVVSGVVVDMLEGVPGAVEAASRSMLPSLSWLVGYACEERKVKLSELGTCCCCKGGSDAVCRRAVDLSSSCSSLLAVGMGGTFLPTSGELLLDAARVLTSLACSSASSSPSLPPCRNPPSSVSFCVAHCRTLQPSPSIKPKFCASRNASKSSKAS